MNDDNDFEAYFDRSLGVIDRCIELFVEAMP
jgi:hypothetical protein